MKQSRIVVFSLIGLFFIFLNTCSAPNNNENNADEIKPATINFFNESSYKIDLYKNLNPDYFDPTTLVCTINSGVTQRVTMYASSDQLIGDTFYPRYKVQLADSLKTGTTNVYIDAQRNLSNISFVVENGKIYTKTIPQPLTGDLKFINGYIAIQNTGSAQVQILKGDEVLYKLDNKGAYLYPGSNIGYYEIPISSFVNTLDIDQLKAFSSSYINFPAFTMERGKLYSFTVNNSVITGPVITNIDPAIH